MYEAHNTVDTSAEHDSRTSQFNFEVRLNGAYAKSNGFDTAVCSVEADGPHELINQRSEQLKVLLSVMRIGADYIGNLADEPRDSLFMLAYRLVEEVDALNGLAKSQAAKSSSGGRENG